MNTFHWSGSVLHIRFGLSQRYSGLEADELFLAIRENRIRQIWKMIQKAGLPLELWLGRGRPLSEDGRFIEKKT